MDLGAPLIRLPIRFSAERLADEVRSLPKSAWLPHPQGFAGNDAVPLVAPAGQISDGMRGPMGPTEHLLACPYIMAIMDQLGGVWGRSRLMGLAAGAEVPNHVDIHYYWRTHIRIHIPIFTNPAVTFTVGETTVHMQAGECWTFDSFQLHDVQNGGSEHRVHLVLDTSGGERIAALIQQGKNGEPVPNQPWIPEAGEQHNLRFERFNAPRVMSPWEIRCHVDFLNRKLANPADYARIADRVEQFLSSWQAAWTEFGDSGEGIDHYRALVRKARIDLNQLGIGAIQLDNLAPLSSAYDSLIFNYAFVRVPTNAPAEPLSQHAAH